MKITTSTEIDGKETRKEIKYICDGCGKESKDGMFNDNSMVLSYTHNQHARDFQGAVVGGCTNKKELLLCDSCGAKILSSISDLKVA